MKKQSVSAHRENKSLKTFFLYSLIVFVVIGISLTIKLITVIQQSKFDGKQHFTIAVVKDHKVEEIVGIDPKWNTLATMTLKGEKPTAESLHESLAITPDATIFVPSDFPVASEVTHLMNNFAWHYNMVNANITFYDIARLIFLSQKIPQNNQMSETMQLPHEEREVDQIIAKLFTDEQIAAENVSIQIINASEISGMGRQLERILVNMGGNVISVSTALNPEESSEIQYFGEETYTLRKLQTLLQLPAIALEEQPIADIVIVVGKDSNEEESL